MYSSVEDWLAAEYKLASVKKKRVDAAGLDYSGLTIRKIFETSPAYCLGLRKGDILFTVNGDAPFNADLETPRLIHRRFGLHKFQFYRPDTEEVITIKSKQWPFGIQLRTSPLEYSRSLRIDDPELDEVENYWRDGDLDAIGTFYEAWEVLNHRMLNMEGKPYFHTDFKIPHHNAPIDGDLWHSNFAYLALVAACAQKYKRARYVLDEIYQRIAESDSGFPCIAASMMHYTESLLCEAEGRKEDAVEYMHKAIDSAWEIRENYERLGRLTGHEVKMPASVYQDIALSYDLPIKDPAQIITQHEGRLDLQKACKNLKPGQSIIVVLLASYRSNYYYNKGWEVSAPILNKLRSKFPQIHIVTSGNYALDESFLKAEKPLARHSLDFKILNDENLEVATRLNQERAPINLALNHRGEVVAESALWDESLIWKALAACK